MPTCGTRRLPGCLFRESVPCQRRGATGISRRGEPQGIGGASVRQYLVSDLLHEGAENGTTIMELVQLTGEDERSIRRRIQTERKAGKLILSDCKSGYFLPTSTLDIQRFINSMSRRSREIAAISRAAEDALLKMTGQETLRGWQNG